MRITVFFIALLLPSCAVVLKGKNGREIGSVEVGSKLKEEPSVR